MKTLFQWYKDDPFAWVLVGIAVVFANLDGLGSIIGVLITGAIICARLLHWSKTLPIALCALLIAQPVQSGVIPTQLSPKGWRSGFDLFLPEPKPQPLPELQGAGVAMGIVVTVIGGVVVYKFVRWCQHYANRTNVVDKMQKADSASAYSGPGSCLADVSDEHVIQLDFKNGKFSASAPEYGPLDLTGIQLGRHYYSGGEEIEPDQSIIHFGAGSVYVDPVERTYILERSTNLEYWEPVLEINQPDMPWTLEDSFEGNACFYRVK